VFIIKLSRDWIIQFVMVYNKVCNSVAKLCKKKKAVVPYAITQPVSELYVVGLYTYISFSNATLFTISPQLKIILKLKCYMFWPYLAILRQLFTC
jgi:hypothetical protein